MVGLRTSVSGLVKIDGGGGCNPGPYQDPLRKETVRVRGSAVVRLAFIRSVAAVRIRS